MTIESYKLEEKEKEIISLMFSYVQVLDFDGVGKPPEYMCCNQFPLWKLQEAHKASDKLELQNKVKKKKKGKSYGQIYIETFNILD